MKQNKTKSEAKVDVNVMGEFRCMLFSAFLNPRLGGGKSNSIACFSAQSKMFEKVKWRLAQVEFACQQALRLCFRIAQTAWKKKKKKK